MTQPYSLDLRERVIARVQAGETVRSVAQTFDVSVSSVVRWSQRFRATGSVSPDQIGGYRPKVLVGECRTWLLARMSSSAFTLRDLVAELAEWEIFVDYKTVWKFVHAEDLSFKKKHSGQRTRSP